MVKRKITQKSPQNKKGVCGGVHCISVDDARDLQTCLLQWYDKNQRHLPWRTIAREEEDTNKRAYSVWVSEVMLQQTQVSTVIKYFNKWIQKWPTLESLSKATLEEVHEVWSGLGYYSRGQRLHQGACKVMSDLGGVMPTTAADLLTQLPGVGRYTAGAIASIALSQVTGVVDGNVSRVLSRLRLVGADITSNSTMEHLWKLADSTVAHERPGDYNQAVMELGATVCTPRAPACDKCPVSHLCMAYKQVEQQHSESAAKLLKTNNNQRMSTSELICDIEDCCLCLPDDEKYDTSQGVMNYPRKAKKKPPRNERTMVTVINRRTPDSPHPQYLIVQRPEKGLLASLWEFPSLVVQDQTSVPEAQSRINDHLQQQFGADVSSTARSYVSEVVHIFSHIHQTYMVETLTLTSSLTFDLTQCKQPAKWVTGEEFAESAISTAMKKVFKAVESQTETKTQKLKKKEKDRSDGKKQLGLEAFFKKK